MGIPGSIIPTTPTLSVSKNRFKPGQSCGNEGKNVFVNEIIKNPSSQFVGAYKDLPENNNSIIVPVMTSNYLDGFVSSASSVFENDDKNYGAWHSFDRNARTFWHSSLNSENLYNLSTGVYEGTSNSNDTDIVNTKQNGQKIIKGEWLQINMPNYENVLVKKYEIAGRENLWYTRSPNTWYIVGWDNDSEKWYEVDFQENQYFDNIVFPSYNVNLDSYSNFPNGFGAYKMIITKVGNNDRTTDRSWVQIAIWNLYGDNRNLIPDNERSMTLNPNIGFTSFNDCQKYAADNGYKYFGLQNYQKSDKTSECLVSNDLNKVKTYGEAVNGFQYFSFWSAGSGLGSYAILKNEGTLHLIDANDNIVYKSNDVYVTLYVDSFSGTAVNVKVGDYPSITNAGFPEKRLSSLKIPDNLSVEIFADRNFDTSKYPSYTFKSGNYPSITNLPGSTVNYNDNVWSIKVFPSSDCYLILQDDGNMCIYKGKDPQDNQGEIWCSKTKGIPYGSDPNRKSQFGKFGRNYMKAGEILYKGEWIGSDNGSYYLIMQEDGFLSLISPGDNIINYETSNDGYTYGNKWVNAVYELDQLGNSSNIGKVGYINENTELSEYPTSMLKSGLQYTKFENYDSAGNDIKQINNIPIDKCMSLCNANEKCGGFVYDTRDSVNNCWLKDNNMYPKSEIIFTKGVDTYLRDPLIMGSDKSCSRQIENIDSVTWENYLKTGQEMTENTKCGIDFSSKTQQDLLSSLQSQLVTLSSEIQNKTTEFINKNKKVSEQIVKNTNYFNDNTKKYIELAKQKKQANQGLENILQDSDIVVLQENYNYMFWSILTVGTVILTLNTIK